MAKTKRFIAVFLALFAFCLFCCGPICQSVQALVGVDDAVIAIVIAALAACGITFVTTGAYETSKVFVEGIIAEYANSVSMTPQQVFYGIDYGRNSLGKIILNNKFVRVISALVTFIKIKYSLSNNSSKVMQRGGYYLGNLEAMKLPVAFVRYGNQNIDYIVYESTFECYVISVNGSPLFVSEYPVTVRCKSAYTGSTDYYTLRKSDGQLFEGWSGSVVDPQVCYYGSNDARYNFQMITSGDEPAQDYSISQAIAALQDFDEITEVTSISTKTGVIEAPEDNSNYVPGDGAILDVGATWGDTLPDITDDVIPGAFEYGQEGEATMTFEEEEIIQEEVVDAGEPSVSQEASDYQVIGLQDVFPFCIPFDIYAFFECLAADPVAPVISWRFYVPGICDETITIDLAQYNTVAQVLRTMELLAFIIGLAFVTREKFLRG